MEQRLACFGGDQHSPRQRDMLGLALGEIWSVFSASRAPLPSIATSLDRHLCHVPSRRPQLPTCLRCSRPDPCSRIRSKNCLLLQGCRRDAGEQESITSPQQEQQHCCHATATLQCKRSLAQDWDPPFCSRLARRSGIDVVMRDGTFVRASVTVSRSNKSRRQQSGRPPC